MIDFFVIGVSSFDLLFCFSLRLACKHYVRDYRGRIVVVLAFDAVSQPITPRSPFGRVGAVSGHHLIVKNATK
jgi:hypothetical protein